MHIPRYIFSDIIKHLQKNKVVVLYGPRQVGKTTLLKEILKTQKEPFLLLSGENRSVKEVFSSESIKILKENIGTIKLLAIDEAQNIPNIGINLKLIVDHIPDIKVIVTGSSSFSLANQVGEPLVGRKWQYILHPLSQIELKDFETPFETKENLHSRMIFGSYPAVITAQSKEEKREILSGLIDNHLYKDILAIEGIRKSQKIISILTRIALQIGKEVSLNEIGQSVGMDLRTIEKYLDLLEKVFIIKRVFGFSRNLRKEITKNSRFYFYDNGIRNALLNNFNDTDKRNDIGELWENYIFIERIKKQEYTKIFSNNYFWRTYDQKEIDLIEEREGKIFGYEFKWGNKKIKPPSDFLESYSNAEWMSITPENYLPFIS
jgi:predicted AAA+ superfamily ATPase